MNCHNQRNDRRLRYQYAGGGAFLAEKDMMR